MTVQILPNGTGELLGDPLVTGAPLYTGNTIYYVYSVTGSDSNNGLSKGFPFATIGHAVSTGAAGDIVVCLDGHTETVTAAVTLSKAGMTIVGSGQSSGKPTVKLSVNGASSEQFFAVTAAGVQIRNLYFSPSLQNQGSASRVTVTAAGFRMRGCYFEQQSGPDLSLYGLELGSGASNARVRSTTFISTLIASLLPQGGLYVSGSGLTDIDVEDCIFDGRYGTAAMFVQNTVTRLRVENPTLRNGAELILDAPSPGYVVMPSATQDGLITW